MAMIKIKGSVKIEHKRDGKVIDTREGDNLVVDTGKALIASRLKDTSDDAISHMACGSSGQVAAESDTALVGTEHQRVSATVTVTDNVITVEATFGSGLSGQKTIAEYGIFNDASSGDMLCRFTTAAQTLDADESDTFDVTWTLQFGD